MFKQTPAYIHENWGQLYKHQWHSELRHVVTSWDSDAAANTSDYVVEDVIAALIPSELDLKAYKHVVRYITSWKHDADNVCNTGLARTNVTLKEVHSRFGTCEIYGIQCEATTNDRVYVWNVSGVVFSLNLVRQLEELLHVEPEKSLALSCQVPFLCVKECEVESQREPEAYDHDSKQVGSVRGEHSRLFPGNWIRPFQL